MGIAGKVKDVTLDLNLRPGVYAYRLVEFRDGTYTGKEGKEGEKSTASVLITKAKPGSKDKPGDKIREINFFTSVEIGKANLLVFYSTLKGKGKEPMEAEAFQEWEGADAFAKSLEIRLSKNPRPADFLAFAKSQEEIAELGLEGEVSVTESQGGYPRFDFAPIGTLNFSAESTAAAEAGKGTAATAPASTL